MQFELTGPYTASRTDSTAPCTLFDDVVGQALPAGNYELIVRAIPAAGIGRDDLTKTIDADQGRSGSHAGERKGFAGLVDEVAHGRAGAVFGLEVSRFASAATRFCAIRPWAVPMRTSGRNAFLMRVIK